MIALGGRRVGAELDADVDRLLGWRRRRLRGLSTMGVLLAVAAYVGTHTTSLLPRPWYLQGVIAAICGLVGYVVGVALGGAGNLLIRWSGFRVTMKASARRTLVLLWLLLLALGIVAFPFATIGGQQYVSSYVGQEPPTLWFVVGSTFVAVAVFMAFIGVWRLILAVFRWVLVRIESHVLRESIARGLAGAATIAVVGLGFDQILLRGGFALAIRQADRVNATSPEGRRPPASPLRSGGPGSAERWESLGQDGALFVSGGPDAAAIRAVTGKPAKEPIRVFAGAGHGSVAATRDAVLAELDRTGAWERRVIYVVTATSTGYVNEQSTSALEYLAAGDTASVSMQYSTLPSAFGLVLDDPAGAARALLDAVRARLAAMPVGSRPRLYVGGESLGAYGGESAFGSPERMLAEVEGALWTGTPYFSPLRRQLTARRNPGSTEVNPVVDLGRNVRFAGRPRELLADQFGRPLGTWEHPRVVYLQHVSDPVAWWDLDLIFRSPPWLEETRLDVPMARMSWYPLVTFWQVTADMSVSNTVPAGFGHRYGADETVPAWAAILGADPTAEYSAITAAIDRASE